MIEADKADGNYFSRARELLPRRYQSPELARGVVDSLLKIPVAADWWALGCVIFEVFCGAIRSPADLKKIDDMPHSLRPDYMRLLSANPNGRLRPLELLQNDLFDDDYVSLQLFLEMLNGAHARALTATAPARRHRRARPRRGRCRPRRGRCRPR